MKKKLSIILAVLMLFCCMVTAAPEAYASTKVESAREIAIVFDNSGSMYDSGDLAWCRATYAMEVFASMLNTGDTLWIYPMHPITVGGEEYTMESPLKITDSAQASIIRDINTEDAGGTPIESIDCAISGLQASQTALKYLIVLTDGGTFSKNTNGLTKARTKTELDNRIEEAAGKNMKVMYLGIGSESCMPDTEESEHFVKKQAVHSADVLSTLTVMCNQVFGRDTLPKNHFSDNSIDFDISMRKLIVFVQGEDIANLKITSKSGNSIGEPVSTLRTKYSTVGTSDHQYKNNLRWDPSLQGMMVTYTDLAAGSYTINYSGTASNVEVYYEPDADLDFVFTDAVGNIANPNAALYEGDYKVSFGIKDAKTGQLISSDLLGNPRYRGSYSINNTEYPITHEGHSGEVSVPLSVNDSFAAELTVTYLSGYTITKNSADFGWPEGGIRVTARPAVDLQLEITGGDAIYSLPILEEGSPYIAKVFAQGQQLTGDALKSVELKWVPETSNAEIKKEFADDHWELHLLYKDPAAPQNTMCGECTVTIYAYYTAPSSAPAQAECPLTYNIVDEPVLLQLDLRAAQDYFVIDKLADGEEINVILNINGAPMSPRAFAATEVQVDCGGIEYRIEADEQNSAYRIKLLPTEGIKEGNYEVKITAQYTDPIERTLQAEGYLPITLSNIPMWVKWVAALLLLLILIIVIWLILHIKMFPKYVRPQTNECFASVNGKNVTDGTTFIAKLGGKKLTVQTEYNGEMIGISLRDLKPGPNGVLCKASHKRNISVAKPNQINAIGEVTQADVNGVLYMVDKATMSLTPEDESQRPFLLANAAMISFDGKITDGGKAKKFHADIPLTFRK